MRRNSGTSCVPPQIEVFGASHTFGDGPFAHHQMMGAVMSGGALLEGAALLVDVGRVSQRGIHS